MYANKDDTAVREHMVKLGHLNPLQGQHKPKVGWNPKYVRSDGNNAPSIYCDDRGLSKEEEHKRFEFKRDFEMIAAGNGAEENKIREAFKKHDSAREDHERNMIASLVEQTTFELKGVELTEILNNLRTQRDSYISQVSAKDAEELLEQLFDKVDSDGDAAITLLHQLTTAALIKKKETEIDEALVERKKHIEKANSLKDLIKAEKTKLFAIKECMEERLK
eukprot:COSAG03_NODE_6040_length_1126_cov_1.521908_1_plen_220_part_10